MREIKFRAWDKRISKMLYQPVGNVFVGRDMRFYPVGFDVHDITHGDDMDLCLMQSTGLKDKNGKEIYEGDIVHCQDEPETKGEIYWNDKLAAWGWRCQFTFAIKYKEFFEVIGNIYENPELVNG